MLNLCLLVISSLKNQNHAYHNYFMNAPYITKTLRKTIMRKFQLETKHLKTKTQTDLKLYKKHKNFWSKFSKGKEENI